MADTAITSDKSAEDCVNIIEANCDLKCECCIRYKIELTKITSELKSAMKMIEILKEQKIEDSLID
jgi:ABC-type ATPase with predicted acetyltransferase domain